MNRVFKLQLIIFVFCFIQYKIYSDEQIEKFPQIKALIDSNQLDKAQIEINKINTDVSTDPNLSYHQSEVWFQKAETEFRNENYKTALSYFEKANLYWAGNIFLSERITETKNRIKYGTQKNNSANKLNSILNQNGNSNNRNINIFIIGKEGKEIFAEELKEILINSKTETIPNPDKNQKWNEFIISISAISIILNLINIFHRRNIHKKGKL